MAETATRDLEHPLLQERLQPPRMVMRSLRCYGLRTKLPHQHKADGRNSLMSTPPPGVLSNPLMGRSPAPPARALPATGRALLLRFRVFRSLPEPMPWRRLMRTQAKSSLFLVG